ncbi:MAG: efflux RND transporter permease subunit [Phycisphaerae bacterium]|nr:efflux RND transporter permease subunit [Phycisphaerae bacterium]NUQ46000.1 efflux RND transporter permease subunit [Phycisphaerae bacterium]
MPLVRAALRNPYFIIVLALGVVCIGGTALYRLPTDILPLFKTPAVQVLTLYPGMPAEIMEKDITNRISRWTGQANGIVRQESRSMIGVSVVRDYFGENIDPNTAMSQVTSLAMSDLYYLPPGTIPPMIMPFDPTASIPLCLLTVYSDTHGEKELYDIAYFELRNRLQGIQGVIAPAVFGGKIRRVLNYVDRDKLQARNLSPMDVVRAVERFNTMIPTGSAKFGDLDYQINANGMVQQVAELNDIPVKLDGMAPVFLKDVADAQDTAAIQTNYVRVNGRRQVYIPIYRQPGANTIQIVDGLKAMLEPIRERLPKGVNLAVTFDQSIYVKDAISNLQHEAILGGGLAVLIILVFLGSIRSTLIISLAIPLSILAAFIGLFFTNHTINVMTLGGLALVLGRLLDDAIVVLENTHRHLRMGKTPAKAAMDAAGEVAMPILVATIATSVVFFPVVFLTGLGRFLFTPLALAVTFSIFASYFVAMTLVPICCAKFFRAHLPEVTHPDGPPKTLVDRLTDRLAAACGVIVGWALRRRLIVVGATVALFIASLLLYPRIGKELFPGMDVGQFTVNVRAPSGTRIENTETLIEQVERSIQATIPKHDLSMMISNIGVLLDWPAAYTPNAGPMDGFILVQLTEDRTRTIQDYVVELRRRLNDEYPGIEFSFDTGGILTAALNFGLPSPINVQVEGNKLETAAKIARRIQRIAERTPGAVDVRIQQKLDYPQLEVDVDRTRAAFTGLDAVEVVKNVVTAFNSSINFNPAFWIDHKSGNHYFIGAQYREPDIVSMSTLEHIPVTGTGGDESPPVLLKNVAKFRRTTAPAEINQVNLSRVVDLFVNVHGRDVGSVAADIEKGIEAVRAEMAAEDQAAAAAGQPKPWEGYRIYMRGEVASMRESFTGLAFGLVLASVLVYLVMVSQFRSFIDPFIVMFSVPLGLIGVLAMLWATNTTVNIQSFIGVIFMVGIAVSNAVLIVEFANRLRDEKGLSAAEAAVESARIRLRPVLMTALAAILALTPMAIGLGHGTDANIPLARAVVGGLSVSTVLIIVFVPVLYTLFKRTRLPPSPVRWEET